jgi:hypothetical protein
MTRSVLGPEVITCTLVAKPSMATATGVLSVGVYDPRKWCARVRGTAATWAATSAELATPARSTASVSPFWVKQASRSLYLTLPLFAVFSQITWAEIAAGRIPTARSTARATISRRRRLTLSLRNIPRVSWSLVSRSARKGCPFRESGAVK